MKMRSERLGVALIVVACFFNSAAFAELDLRQIADEQGAEAVGQAVFAAVQAVYAENTDPDVIEAKLGEILNEAAAIGDEVAVREAIGQVVLAAGQAVYAGNTDPVVIQVKLTQILDKVAAIGTASGNEQPVRYAIVAIMMAGGSENVGISEAAVSGSTVSSMFGNLAANTVSETKDLMAAAQPAAADGQPGASAQSAVADGQTGDAAQPADGQTGDAAQPADGAAGGVAGEGSPAGQVGGGFTGGGQVDPGNPFGPGSLTGGQDGDRPATPI